MLVRFWGTRGSLPASLNYLAVRSKIRDALVAARGEVLDSDQAIEAFIDRLPFPVRGTYGGNSTCDNVTYRHLVNIKRVAHGVD